MTEVRPWPAPEPALNPASPMRSPRSSSNDHLLPVGPAFTSGPDMVEPGCQLTDRYGLHILLHGLPGHLSAHAAMHGDY